MEVESYNIYKRREKKREDKTVKLRKAMEKKIALAFLVVLFLVSSELDVTVADVYDCMDACTTACVTSNPDCNIFFFGVDFRWFQIRLRKSTSRSTIISFLECGWFNFCLISCFFQLGYGNVVRGSARLGVVQVNFLLYLNWNFSSQLLVEFLSEIFTIW